jgi:hypothetical protein
VTVLYNYIAFCDQSSRQSALFLTGVFVFVPIVSWTQSVFIFCLKSRVQVLSTVDDTEMYAWRNLKSHWQC